MQAKNNNQAILRIALPAIVSNITTPVLGLVDVAIVGHFGAAAFIGAIAVGSTMFNMLYWLFGFLRMSTAGITSQAYGADDRRALSASLFRSLALSLIIGLALIALSTSLGTAILNFIDADDASAAYALRYFHICIWGAPAVLGTYTLTGWLLGLQDTRTPMLVAIIIDVANILLSLALVFGLHMRIEGVATGTLCAQWLGMLIMLGIALRRYRPAWLGLRPLLHKDELRRLFSVNTDIFLRTLCLVAVTTWFTRAGASQNLLILSANAILMQLFMLFSYFSDGFAFAGEALAGKYYGAADYTGLRSIERALLRWGLGIAAAFTLIYAIGGEVILGLLTDDSAVRATAARYLPWAVMIPIAGIYAFIYDGIFIGTTLTRRMLTAMAIATAVFFAAYFTLISRFGNHALWLAFILYLLARSVAMRLLFNIRH